MKHFGDIAFTDHVKDEQTARGSRDMYAGMTARPAPDGFGEREAAFISMRDSFYMATVSEEGWPYIQHRGGPRGFLKVLSETQLGFADYRGNRQYVSVGNLQTEKRVSLFLMDYPNRARLKLLGRASVQEAEDNPELAEQLAIEGQGKVERLFMIEVEAFDWNCPQFITPRFTEAELSASLIPMVEELQALRQENAFLKQELGR
ncbi:MAG: pyridoxamine 5'-phosphate oxidase family protein [Hyphomonadaceae bacterium]|nr:pyridoxamine 5'-phosphate oxidase family protein [Hyphomonadaceae bacterium]